MKTLIGEDNLRLSVNDYLTDDANAVILCVHGMCEHSKRYEDFARFLNKQGYSVYTYDHRGHGLSLLENENKGYLGKDGFNKLVRDLHTVVTYIKDKHQNHKLFVLGHSMGSFVLQRYLQLYGSVDGAILSGSNYGTKLIRFGKLLSKVMCIFIGEKKPAKLIEKLSFGNYNILFAPNRTAFDWLSSDDAEVDKYINDDLCGFTCSNRFYYDFFAGLLELSEKKNFRKIADIPILIISGAKDPVGYQGEGVKALYRVLNSQISNVDLKLYPEGRHEMLNEVNKTEVYEDIVDWLNKFSK